MSDSSEPQRIEALESKMEQLMGMMSQVLQATSTGDGQRRELMESGSTGRGVAHNESGGASRAPPTADTSPGDTAVGATAAAEESSWAEEQHQSHQDRDPPSTPAGD